MFTRMSALQWLYSDAPSMKLRACLSLVLGIALSQACSFGAETAARPQWAAPAVEQILPGVWRIRFGTPERFTPVSVRESAPRVQGFQLLPAPTPVPFEPDQIRCRISPSRTTVYVPCREPG